MEQPPKILKELAKSPDHPVENRKKENKSILNVRGTSKIRNNIT